MKINSLFLGAILISFFFLPYVSFLGFSQLPTWRFANIIFVLVAIVYFRKIKYQSFPSLYFFLAIIFYSYIQFQIILIFLNDKLTGYEISFSIALFFLLAFGVYYYILLSTNYKISIKYLKYSIIFLIIYQIFQFVSYHCGFPKYVSILNQSNVTETSNFFRIIGGILGPSSFMAESGHLAFYLGPILMYFLISNYYKKTNIRGFTLVCMLLSIFLTLSTGAVLQLFFLVIVYFATNKQIFFRRSSLLLVAFFISLLFIFFSNAENLHYFIFKIQSFSTNDSPRFAGAAVFMQNFYDNFFFGIAPKSSRYILEADPNMFLPVLLADHGIIGATLFLMLFIIPILYAYIFSKHKLYIIPYVCMFIHLNIAYGTYTWPYIWIIYVLVLNGLNFKNNETATESTLHISKS